MQCQNEFPKRSKEQTKASKVQVKSELRDFSRPWWHEGGVQGGHLRFESFARNISDDDDGITMLATVMKTKTTLAVRKECMKKSSSCSLGQITSSVTCTQCFQYILSDTFLGMVAGEPSLLQDSHELKRKT